MAIAFPDLYRVFHWLLHRRVNLHYHKAWQWCWCFVSGLICSVFCLNGSRSGQNPTFGLFFFPSSIAPGKLKKTQVGEMVVLLSSCSKKHFINFSCFCCYFTHQVGSGLTEQLCLAITSMCLSTIVAKYVFTYLLPQLLLWENVVQVCNSSMHLLGYWNYSDFILLLLKAEIDTQAQ